MKVHGNTEHGHAKRSGRSRTWRTWSAMLRRCDYPSQDSYHLYGGRGIKVCVEWRTFDNFLADMGEQPDGTSIDRIDNDGDYRKENCRWIQVAHQARNRRNNVLLTHDGKTMCIAEWAESMGIAQHTLRARIYDHGWSVERALSEPLRGAK